MATRKSEDHEFDVADPTHGHRSVKVHIRMCRSFQENEDGFNDEEISEIKEAEKAFITAIEKIICK